jgi:molybdopterin converting factor small subunit
MSEPQNQIQVTVHFYSFFKDLAGCSCLAQTLPVKTTLGELLRALSDRFPKLAPMQKSVLTAVGVEYQDRQYVLQPGDEVSLFPPVQGG